MQLIDAIRLALRAITAQRLRSALTLLGIAVGIASVILLTSIGEGIHRFVLAEFTQFGTNIIGITPGKVKTSGPAPTGIPSSVRPLTLEDAELLGRLPMVTGVSPMVWGNIEIGANGVLEPKGQFLGIDLDDAAYVPVARSMELFNREGLMNIDVAYREGVPSAAVVDSIQRLLVARHGRQDFTLVTQEDMLRTLSNILGILTMAVGALGDISLLVGAVGIVTIM